MLYFAFGSNMCLQQMTRRCPASVRIGVGRLADYRLRFPRPGAVWAGGVADVVPDAGQQVFGVLYDLSDVDMQALDAHEVSYQREVVAVERWAPQAGEDQAGGVATATVGALAAGFGETLGVSAAIYRVTEALGRFPPHVDYLARMVSGAREAGVPAEYLGYLAGIGSVG